MGRKSDYHNQAERDATTIESDEEIKDFEHISKKYCKEDMTPEEFGIYLGGCKNSKLDALSDKTIIRYIKKLCSISDGKLKDTDFKINGKWILKPEYHEFMIALFDTDYFGAPGKPKGGVDEEQRLRAQLAVNIGIYISEPVETEITSSSQYLNARLEDHLTEKINNEFKGIMATILDSDEVIRYQLMLEMVDRLVALRRWMNEWNARIKLIKQEFANSPESKKDAENGTGLFKQRELQDLLIDRIEAIIKNEPYEYLNEEDEISMATFYAAYRMYDITGMPGNYFTEWLNTLDENISNDYRYRILKQKLRLFMNEDDLLEGKIIDSMDKIMRTQLVSNETELTPEQYELMIRMQEDAIKDKKIELLCKLDLSGDGTLDEKTLKEIMDIKDAVKKRKEVDLDKKK